MATTDESREMIDLAYNALAGRLAHDVAHQINNLLVGITGVDDVLDCNTLRDMRRALMTSMECGRRIGDLVQAFQQSFGPLDLTACSTGTGVGEILDRAIVLCRKRAGWNSIAVEADYHDLPNVRGNAVALSGAFTTLVCETLDALGNGGVLRVSGQANKGRVQVEIQGITLPGLAEGGRNPSGAPDERGRGGDGPRPMAVPGQACPVCALGLTAARLVLEGYGGSLAADRGPVGGSRFTATLPVQEDRTALGAREQLRANSMGFGEEVPRSSTA